MCCYFPLLFSLVFLETQDVNYECLPSCGDGPCFVDQIFPLIKCITTLSSIKQANQRFPIQMFFTKNSKSNVSTSNGLTVSANLAILFLILPDDALDGASISSISLTLAALIRSRTDDFMTFVSFLSSFHIFSSVG